MATQPPSGKPPSKSPAGAPRGTSPSGKAPPRPQMSKKKPQKVALQFGKPEKRNWVALAFFWTFVIGGIATSIWLLHKSPHMHSLECDTSSGMGGLTGFGRCHESTE